VVRDRDSHAWTQVYFPGYGWIDFEPTPGRQPPPRGPLPEAGAGSEGDEGTGIGEEDFFLADDVFLAEAAAGLAGGEGQGLRRWSRPVVLGLGLLGLLALVLWLTYRSVFVSPRGVEGVFRRLAWLGRVAGAPLEAHHTPREFAQRLGRLAPEVEGEVAFIAEAYARVRYGRRPLAPQEVERLRRAWRRARQALWRKVLRR
jgi:hypothetical protein